MFRFPYHFAQFIRQKAWDSDETAISSMFIGLKWGCLLYNLT